MKGLKEFLEEIEKNEALSERVSSAQDVTEIAKIAQEEGFEVSEEEINDMMMEAVSGGAFDWRQAGMQLAQDALNSASDALSYMGQGASAGDAFKAAGIGLASKTIKNVTSKIK